MPVTGLGNTSNSIRYCAKSTIKSRIASFSENVTFLVLPSITGRLPSRHVDRSGIPIPSNIKLADPEFNKPAAIEALLGEYLFYKLLCVGQIRLPNGRCVLQKTRLGWLISGETNCQHNSFRSAKCHLANHDLNDQVANFWKIEECPSEKHFSLEEKACEQHFQDNTYRDDQGRYVVRLPFNKTLSQLGTSGKMALKRFYTLENRLESQPELKQQYKEFINEYLQLGHMSLVKQDCVDEGFYLLHHAVLKSTSSRTRLRVVFDASAKSSSGISLNDTLLVGPTIQDDIFQLITRFRTHNYVLTVDIEKMFRQVRIHATDAKFQKILWRNSKDDTVQTYQLDTVTYGTAPAPFLAVRTLTQLAEDEGQAFPLAADALKHDFYGAFDKCNKLISLNPFLDDKGIIRVGGRLRNADIKYTQRYPIILPKSHPVTALITQFEHQQTLHSGIQGTLNAVRQRYWPVDGKNMTRHIIRKCLRCFKAKPTGPPDYLMGNLPRDRLVATRPFENTGVDYCGPLFVKEKRFRNQKRLKVYGAVFICFVTKAVHSELVSDLTTEAFLAALNRFFSRRGRSKNIYSDNATNFIGAKNEIAELLTLVRSRDHNDQVARHLANVGIVWHCSPPRSPHFGGLWEAAVKSFKHHLIRTVGDTLLTYEQLNTYVVQIEAILNSRPLTPLSSDPNDLQSLTPAHFLIGESLTSLPEHDFTTIATNRLSLWQHIQRIKQHFWTRWHKEYLNELSIRSKWKSGASDAIKVDMLVLLRDETLPAMRWPLGRVMEIHPGHDGVVRVATIKTANGVYKRSVKKLCPLPTQVA
ncbi:uncharacterized protein LOC143260874 [Megalopta genalis]|uniref:uncharacterized protein LOC143260874 n=1 Tax=Megalopta genalis TaxID=115081 RepID=UPI003FD62D2E